MPKKLTRKQIVKQDVVKSTIVSFWENLQAHPIRITAIVVLFVGILIVGLSLKYYAANKDENAHVLLTKVLTEFNGPERNPFLKNQVQISTVLPEKKFKEMEKNLYTIIRDYPGTKYASQALYFLGIVQMKQSHIDDSINTFQKSIASKQDDITSYLAKFCLAQAYSKKKSYNEATKILQELTDDQNSLIPKDYLYWELSYIYEMHGKKAQSKMLLQKIMSEFPMSSFRTEIEEKLKTL